MGYTRLPLGCGFCDAGIRRGAALPLLLLASLFLFSCGLRCACAAETPRPPGSLPRALEITIELSTSGVEFYQPARPGVLDLQRPVELRVTCLAASWSVAAKATPLAKQDGSGQIGPERLFIRTAATQAHPDVGAGLGFVPLNDPVIVAAGSIPTFSTPLELRLLTLWEDTPGTYSGDIQFTVVASP